LGAIATLVSAPFAIGLNAMLALLLMLPIMTLTPLFSGPSAAKPEGTKPDDRLQ
jgi:hypothetical protein